MEPTEGKLSPNPGGAEVWGELIVQNGRLSGTSRPLDTPLILIGQWEGCDFRLNAQGINPLHCVLVRTPAGVVLRDLHSTNGTFVNDRKIACQVVHGGEVLAVGPFRFRIQVKASAGSSRPAPGREEPLRGEGLGGKGEREALRIQAAAVAAQQAALTEDEIRLQQRRTALEQQEAQLADHLEEKRRRLIELRLQAREAHALLKQERTEHAHHASETMRQLEADRAELADSRQHALTERRRLVRLRQRLKQRLHRHWAAEREAQRRREDELDGRRRELEQDRERLQLERDELYRVRLRCNGEAELSKRQLQEAWDQLHQVQQQREEQRTREWADFKEQARAIEQRELDLLDAERRLAEERQRAEHARLQREKEAEGLEVRIRNQRRKLLELEQETHGLEDRLEPLSEASRKRRGTPHGPEASPANETAPAMVPSSTDLNAVEPESSREAEPPRRLPALEKLAGELADQRLHLAEQCERLGEARRRWQQERDEAAAALEPLALRLHEREQALSDRERELEALAAEQQQRRDECVLLRQHLDAWQSRVAIRAAAWEGERDRLRAELRSREELAERQLEAVAGLRQRWQQRRRQELERLQALLAVCEKLRQECTMRRDDWLRRFAALEQERRTLAERSQALEQYRQECLARALDPEQAEQRLERLRRRWGAEFESLAQPLVQQCQALNSEATRLEECLAQLHKQAARLGALDADLSRRDTEHQHQQLQAESHYARQRQEMQCLRDQADVYERQLRDLNEEVERLARALLDETPVTLPLSQAA